MSLSGCRIGTNGAKKLYDAISENTILKILDLSNCDIGNEGFGYIASALSNNRDLESVNLSDNHLDETCSEDLRNLLSHFTGLTHLDLSWNSLYNAKTWKALDNGLKKNESLRSLNLSWNALDTECVHHLSRLLSRLRNIEKLDLSCKYVYHILRKSILMIFFTNNYKRNKKRIIFKNILRLRDDPIFSKFACISLYFYSIKNEIEND